MSPSSPRRGISRWVAYFLIVATVLCTMGAGSVWALSVEIDIDPTRTYLNLAGNDATAIELSDYGIVSGDTIRLETFGYFRMYPDDVGMNTNMGAVFSSSNVLLPTSFGVDSWNRVPGAIDAGTDMVTDAPGFIPWLFDIDQDFRVDPSLMIQVPNGAAYLFVASVDAFFLDNSVPEGGSFGVRISQVPEPSTLWLFGIGLAGLGLLRWARNAGLKAPSRRPIDPALRAGFSL